MTKRLNVSDFLLYSNCLFVDCRAFLYSLTQDQIKKDLEFEPVIEFEPNEEDKISHAHPPCTPYKYMI